MRLQYWSGGYKECVDKKRPGDTIKEICPNCGRSVLVCTCHKDLSKASPSAEWPMSGDGPRSGSEMTAKFSQLKKSGTGTMFATASPDRGADPIPGGQLVIDLAAGAIIGGIYEIIRMIGRGGMGEVYLARHMTLNKNCALKVIPPDQVTEVTWLRFQLEAKTVAQLNHVNLVRVTDLGIHEDCLPFYAMEHLEGSNLAELISEHGTMPLNRALETFIQVCHGVECAHEAGILHRDLKPANIMLMKTQKGKLEVKILDFGLAKLTKHDRTKQSLTAVGDIFGSPSYMSPEQCGGDKLDGRSDIYSIGCTLFECLTGQPPFAAQDSALVFLGHLTTPPPTLASVSGDGVFPPAMERAIARMLAKTPDERYQTVAELKAELETIAAGLKNNKPKPGLSDGSRIRKPVNNSSPQSATSAGARVKLLMPLAVAALVGSIATAAVFYTSALKPAVPTEVPPASSPLSTTVSTAAPTASTASDTPEATEAPPFLMRAGKAGVGPAEKWDGKPFYAGTVEDNHRKYNLWTYHGPPDPPCYLEFDGPRRTEKVPLFGDVYIPLKLNITLWPRLPLIRDPKLIAGLAGVNCEEVDFRWFGVRDVAAVTPTLSASQSIKALSLGNLNWKLEDSRASIALINRYPNIERLLLWTPYEGIGLMQLQRLRDLTDLRINFVGPHVKDCLEAASNASVLRTLVISEWRLPLEDLKIIGDCPGLEKLVIGGLQGTSEQLTTLAALPNLRELDLPDLRYRHDLVADLARFKTLKVLRFLPSRSWKGEEIVKIQKDLPAVKLDLYDNSTRQWQSLSHP